MLKRRLLIGAAVLVSALVSVQTASASDAAATQAYLHANYALLKVAGRNLKVSEAAYRRVLQQVTAECPAAAANSPQNSQSTSLSNEVIGAMVLVAAKPDLAAIKSYLHAVAGLRWSNAAVEHAITSYRGMLQTLSTLTVPSLCADVRSWSSGEFKSLPSSTVSFDKAFMPNWVALGLVPPSLKRLENAEGKAIARRSQAIETKITEAEAGAVETWGNIMDELKLEP